jgi:TIGR03009 family protein
MRPVGLILAGLLATAAAWGQAPPVAPPPPPPAGPAPNALAAHLAGWENAMRGMTNFRANLDLTRTDAVFKKARKYTGSILCMKPNFARLRLDNTADPKDYEAFICNGKSVFEYSGLMKTIVEHPIPANAGPGQSDQLMLDFLSGMTAQAVQQRFQIAVFKEDANYVYLDIKPVLEKDRKDFVHVRFALLGPGVQAPHKPYLPVTVWVKKPNDDEELWSFNGHGINLPGVEKNMFEFQNIPGFTFQRAPTGGGPGPGPVPKK